ncbi:MAG: ABC transporter permease [Acidobacteriota bacterium]|nr:ABC transporter permease [Acidobacteriota bacterium]
MAELRGWIERAVLAWLRAAAPRGWADTVIGDLREELDARAGWRRARTLAQMSVIAARFTAEAMAARLRRRSSRKGPRNMDILTDLRHATRALARTPGFSLIAIVTLAIAIGANTAIYSALSTLVLNPLPFKDGNRFVQIWHVGPGDGKVLLTPSRDVSDRWRRETPHAFEAIETYGGENLVLTGTGEPEEVEVTFLNPSTLPTFGVSPVVGRAFVERDFEASAEPVVLISHAIWQSRFGADPDISGKPVELGGTAYTIVGVMPRRFALPMGSDVMWAASRHGSAPAMGQFVLAKLAPGVSAEQAQAALDAVSSAPEGSGSSEGWAAHVMTAADHNGPTVKTALFVLTGAVGLLLLIACVNVANLVLMRNSSRRREVALRQALGASRGRLVRYLLVESALLAVSGGIAGLAVARAGLAAMSALRPRELDVLERIALDANALLFTLAVTAATGMVFGFLPAISASRANLQEVLTAGGRSVTSGGQRVRGLLTVGQVALALVLIIGAGLLIRSYSRLMAVDPGFDPRHVLSVRVSLPSDRYPRQDREKRLTFFDEALASIASLEGVESAAAGMGVPLDSGILFGNIAIQGRTFKPGVHGSFFFGGYVTPAYFSTLSIRLVEGRFFTADDTVGREPVAIVGQDFAADSWPSEKALGKRFRIDDGDPWVTVVGVVNDVKVFSLARQTDDHPQIYLPRAQTPGGSGVIIVRTAGDPLALVPAIKTKIWALDPALPLREISTAEQLVRRSTSQSRFNLTLLGIFAACGLVLAVVGVYGVTALFVGQRQREVGIRMALGATRAAVAALVLRQTAIILGLAVVAGGAGAWLLSRYLESMVFATATTDALTFAAAIAAIVSASIAATLVPLRRATSVDPAIVLRAE